MSDDQKATLASLEEECKELCLTNFFVTRPCTWLSICYALMIAITIVCVRTGMIELSESEGRDWLVWSDPIIYNNDKRSLAKKYFEE